MGVDVPTETLHSREWDLTTTQLLLVVQLTSCCSIVYRYGDKVTPAIRNVRNVSRIRYHLTAAVIEQVIHAFGISQFNVDVAEPNTTASDSTEPGSQSDGWRYEM